VFQGFDAIHFDLSQNPSPAMGGAFPPSLQGKGAGGLGLYFTNSRNAIYNIDAKILSLYLKATKRNRNRPAQTRSAIQVASFHKKQ
jgi:hypothetical protein